MKALIVIGKTRSINHQELQQNHSMGHIRLNSSHRMKDRYKARVADLGASEIPRCMRVT